MIIVWVRFFVAPDEILDRHLDPRRFVKRIIRIGYLLMLLKNTFGTYLFLDLFYSCFFLGIVRETEQRGDQRRESVCQRLAEKYGAAGSGESLQSLRQNYHVANIVRQHHR